MYITRLIPVNGRFIALPRTMNKVKFLASNNTDKQLEENEFAPQLPPQLKAHRSALLFKVDNHSFENRDDIKVEIGNRNEWIGEVSNVHKFPKGYIIKITFAGKAKKALDNGLKMFSMKIPSYDINQDNYINIMTCLRCCKMEEHSTAQCDEDITYKICLECSSRNHTWRDYNTGNKRCISCTGPHSTLAARCPKRKQLTNLKREAEQEKENIT